MKTISIMSSKNTLSWSLALMVVGLVSESWLEDSGCVFDFFLEDNGVSRGASIIKLSFDIMKNEIKFKTYYFLYFFHLFYTYWDSSN